MRTFMREDRVCCVMLLGLAIIDNAYFTVIPQLCFTGRIGIESFASTFPKNNQRERDQVLMYLCEISLRLDPYEYKSIELCLRAYAGQNAYMMIAGKHLSHDP